MLNISKVEIYYLILFIFQSFENENINLLILSLLKIASEIFFLINASFLKKWIFTRIKGLINFSYQVFFSSSVF